MSALQLEDLEKWFENNTKQSHAAVATRACLRGLPQLSVETNTKFQEVETLYTMLICGLAAKSSGPSDVFAAPLSFLRKSDKETVPFITQAVRHLVNGRLLEGPLFSEFSQAITSSIAAISSAVFYNNIAAQRRSTDTSDVHEAHMVSQKTDELASGEVQLDIKEVTGNGEIWTKRLWSDEGNNHNLRVRLDRFLTLLHRDRTHTDWWVDWYMGFWNGEPIDWELQEQIARIDKEIWSKGHEAVGPEIERIRARLAVRDSIAEIRKKERVDENSRHSVGGNNPPEAIADPIAQESVTLIWSSIDALEHEVEKTKPDHEAVRKAYQGLTSGLLAFIKWTGRKADLAVDSAIKWSIPVVGAGYAAVNPDKVSGLIKLVEQMLKLLP